MRVLLSTLFLAGILSGGFQTIPKINQYSKLAATAYIHKNYTEAIAAYNYLLQDLEVQDDQLRLNLAHSYYQAGLYIQAQQQYNLISEHPSNHLRAVALLQLGNIANIDKKYKQGISFYKQALIAEPHNENARYNYELLKKYLELHPEKAEETSPERLPDTQDQNLNDSLQVPPPASEELEPQTAKKPDNQGTEQEEIEKPGAENGKQQQQTSNAPTNNSNKQSINQEKEEISGEEAGDVEGFNTKSIFDENQPQRSIKSENVAEGDVRAQTQRERLQKMNISPERAKLLLDAMRNAELQYLQQLPKKATRKPDKSKPDW